MRKKTFLETIYKANSFENTFDEEEGDSDSAVQMILMWLYMNFLLFWSEVNLYQYDGIVN